MPLRTYSRLIEQRIPFKNIFKADRSLAVAYFKGSGPLLQLHIFRVQNLQSSFPYLIVLLD